ncbi:hypothetical protein [Dyadobacter sp. CY323]|uniref:hypothetical protein n=1 Tax=Dyadobacter sp. CY323 TaxID=2907302 RepID=UPI001F31EFCB|nr:hypothetical protein [Dyadobacter sp. CY323]MCE6989563.1 hypothetical protein [Dyadobacter sp. CY323]
MEQGYALEWFDCAVNKFKQKQEHFENYNDHQLQGFSEEVERETARQISYLKRLAFLYPRKRKFQEALDFYFGAINNLIDNAELNLQMRPDELVNMRRAVQVVVASLRGIHSFIVERYSIYIDPDVPLRKYHLEVTKIDFAQVSSSNLFMNSPSLASLLNAEFKRIFNSDNVANVTSRQVAYWKALHQKINGFQLEDIRNEQFCSLELLLIERNFNSTTFVRYLTNRFTWQIEELTNNAQVINHLALVQKLFNQIPVIKGLAYDQQYDNLSATINNWFIYEMEFRSQSNIQKVNQAPATIAKSSNYIKKTADKVLCNLTVDQLALFFKAADQSKVIAAKSLSAIFQAVAPYLSTPYKDDISHGSLRSKSYSAEERDKELLLDFIAKLTRQIEEL